MALYTMKCNLANKTIQPTPSWETNTCMLSYETSCLTHSTHMYNLTFFVQLLLKYVFTLNTSKITYIKNLTQALLM